jgi:hypothetical protein
LDSGDEHIEKKIRREDTEDETPAGIPPVSDPPTASVPILRNENRTQFREVLGGIWPGR